jgi:ribosomal protein L11 methyltransferase
LAVTADQEAVEQVSEILSRVCEGGVAVEAPFDLVDDGLGARIDPTRPVVVRGYVSASDAAAADAAVDRVRMDLGHLQAFGLRSIGEVEARVVHEEDWADAWKENFPIQRIGEHIVIQPSWRSYDPRPGDVVLRMDPGMAFGTGLHPTTRLCLRGIEAWSAQGFVDGARVLDVGTGSGILAVAAAALGASSVLAVDTDPLAVETCARNATINGRADVIETGTGSLPLRETVQFDLALANLIASVLIELAEPLAAVVRPGGRLLASGIFHDREREVSAALGEAGLRVVGRTVETDWVALELVRGA